ncbi:MAG: lysophospholipid acyltransferase family protein [Gemmatimonadales bacterium]
MIRTIRYLTATGLYTAWYGSRAVALALIGVKHQTGGSISDRLQRVWGRKLLTANRIEVVVGGPGRLPGTPVVYVSNHSSWIDIWALLATLPGSPRFVAKKELMKVPLLGQAMRAIGHVTIDRSNRASAFDSYDRAADAIRGGVSVVVFAEGTRSRTGRLAPLKKGPFVLAIAAGVPIVPLYCAGTFECLPKGSLSPVPATVEIRVGEPIATAGLDYEARDRLSGQARDALIGMGAVPA